jgi:hypothetical protein
MPTGAEICVDLFKSVEMPLGSGLSEDQLGQIEADFSFTFDKDHRELLTLATPLVDSWPNWRGGTTEQMRRSLAWPTEGIIWDAHNNDFWPRVWGRKPKRSEDLEAAILAQLARVPKLVPLFGHRFMAAGPSQGSAPVFSVYQTDVVYYGENLPSYVAHELEIPKRYATGIQRKIPFWSNLAENDRRYVGKPQNMTRAFWNRSILGGPALPEATPDGTPITYTSTETNGPIPSSN